MTMPTIISNYNKKATVTKLKRTYSVLQQAYEHSVVDYGDSSNWTIAGYLESANTANKQIVTENFAKTYLIPYLIKVKKAEFTTLGDFGYKKISLYPSLWSSDLDNKGLVMLLSDGTVLILMVNSDNYGTAENRDDRIVNIIMFADLNGLRKPNENGKDIFVFKWDFIKSSLDFYSRGKRDDIKKLCAKHRHACGQLIRMDSWQIKSDYPHKI